MTTTTGSQMIVSCTVASSGSRPDGSYFVEVDVPAFQSNYPTKLSGLGKSTADLLIPGTTHQLLLKRENLKRDKSGNQKSGDALWDYYWGLVRIVLPGEGTDEEELFPEATEETRQASVTSPRTTKEKQRLFKTSEMTNQEGQALGNSLSVVGGVLQSWIARFATADNLVPDEDETSILIAWIADSAELLRSVR